MGMVCVNGSFAWWPDWRAPPLKARYFKKVGLAVDLSTHGGKIKFEFLFSNKNSNQHFFIKWPLFQESETLYLWKMILWNDDVKFCELAELYHLSQIPPSSPIPQFSLSRSAWLRSTESRRQEFYCSELLIETQSRFKPSVQSINF